MVTNCKIIPQWGINFICHCEQVVQRSASCLHTPMACFAADVLVEKLWGITFESAICNSSDTQELIPAEIASAVFLPANINVIIMVPEHCD